MISRTVEALKEFCSNCCIFPACGQQVQAYCLTEMYGYDKQKLVTTKLQKR